MWLLWFTLKSTLYWKLLSSKLGGWWLLFACSLKQLCHSWWCLQIHERLQPGSVYYNLRWEWSWKNRQVLLFDTESFCVLHELVIWVFHIIYACLLLIGLESPLILPICFFRGIQGCYAVCGSSVWQRLGSGQSKRTIVAV